MSFASTQNLDASYNNLQSTLLQTTTLDTGTLVLSSPIQTSNTKAPTINQLGYYSITQNVGDILPTTNTLATLATTAATNPIGIYSYHVKVPIEVGAGCTLTNVVARFRTAAGVVNEVTETVEIAENSLTTINFSGVFFNQNPQTFSINITATFAGGVITIADSTAEMMIVRNA